MHVTIVRGDYKRGYTGFFRGCAPLPKLYSQTSLSTSFAYSLMAQYTLEKIVRVFEMLPTWDDKYAFLTEVGEKMEALPAEFQLDAHRVHGCMSKVWVIGERQADGRLHLRADCDTPVVKGLVALLVVIFQDKTPEEIMAADVDALFQQLGLYENISPNRHVGMYAMVDKIKKIANEHHA